MSGELVNLISLAVLGCIDYVSYKIPNVILCGWIATYIVCINLNSITYNQSLASTILASLLVTGSFLPLHHIVKCSAGDFKLFGVLTITNGLEDVLWIILITHLFSLFPLASGIKKVQIAPLTFFGYIAFLLFRK